MMTSIPHYETLTNRRDFLRRAGGGFGALAAAALMGEDSAMAALGDAGDHCGGDVEVEFAAGIIIEEE